MTKPLATHVQIWWGHSLFQYHKDKSSKELENDDNRNLQKQKKKKSRWSSPNMMWEKNQFTKTFKKNKEKEHSTTCFIYDAMRNINSILAKY